MTGIQVFSLVLLVVAFAIAIWRHVNVGLVMLPAAYLLAAVSHTPLAKLYSGFPASLVVLVLGVMYLFGHTVRSGGMDRLVRGAERAVGRRDWLLPWVSFILAALISAIGALPAASLAIVVPIAMQTARRREINSMLMGVVTILGALAGGFSPISVWGVLIQNLGQKAGFSTPMYALFGLEFVLILGLAVVAFFVFHGWSLMRRDTSLIADSEDSVGEGDRGPDEARFSRYEIGSLAAVLVFVVAVLAIGLDVGLTAFALGMILHIVFRPDERDVIRSLPWAVVLIIAGVLTYVDLLLEVGTLKAVSDHLQGIGSVTLSILALVYFAAIFASFESSSVAVLGIVIPVVMAVEKGLPAGGLFLVIAAVAFSTVTVSTSPFHLSGALVMGNSADAVEADVLFNKLLYWTIATVLVMPLVGWAITLFAT